MRPADRTSPDTEQVWWTAALDADLPPGALAGASGFATALTDREWLPLARRSAAHTPAQEDAGQIAERAVAHPEEHRRPPLGRPPAHPPRPRRRV